jgi:tRNA pseudouridine13 synthase
MLGLFYCYCLSMKLKQQPTDFIVEEIPNIMISSEKDEHSIFLLEKQEVDTFDAIRQIAKKLRISLFEIGYAGLKDKHAMVRQYISIPTHYNVQGLNVDSLTLTFVGYHRKKIKIGDLAGNRFTIIVRDIRTDELADITKRASTIPISGVPNYFDSQRFGSVIDNEFIGKLIILKKYDHAVKRYLTAYQKSEPKKVKDEKRKILSSWNDLSKMRIYNKAFAMVVKEYLNTSDWLAAYRKIPSHLREMFVNAYQSYLWNECVKEILKNCVETKKLYSVEYAIGSLLFYTTLSEHETKKIPKTFQTISENASFSNDEQRIIDHVLMKEGLKLADFEIESETGNFFKTRARQVLLILNDFAISEPTEDALNSRGNIIRRKIQVSFSLPKGSYATIITKRLFNH